jgi:hypothetical protein
LAPVDAKADLALLARRLKQAPAIIARLHMPKFSPAILTATRWTTEIYRRVSKLEGTPLIPPGFEFYHVGRHKLPEFAPVLKADIVWDHIHMSNQNIIICILSQARGIMSCATQFATEYPPP